jgi:2-aminoadipate transaminase
LTEDSGSTYDDFLSRTGKSLTKNAIRKLAPLITRPDIISFAAGAPSPEIFPTEELALIASEIITRRGNYCLQYGPTRGNSRLLEQVGEYLRRRGVPVSGPSEMVITTGSQQGLDLAARVLLDPGDVALVELPSYVGGTIALHNCQAELVGVRQDEHGIVIEDLREKLARLKSESRRVKCFYTIPNFQNPSGVTLSHSRRLDLIEAANEYDFLIIEDDPYYELYFDDEVAGVPPLAALAPGRVIYVSSFSKVLAPGLRTAWLWAPEPIASKIELMKEGADLSSSQLDMAIVNEAIVSGLIERRLPSLREFYSLRCRTMAEALQREAPDGSRWTVPRGGFFVLMEAPEGFDASAFLPQAIESGVAYVPGQPFYVDSGGANTLRLAFSKETPEKIAEGTRRLCRAMKTNNG